MASQRKSGASRSSKAKNAVKKAAPAARPKPPAKAKAKAPAAPSRPAAKVKSVPVAKTSAPKKIAVPAKASKAPVQPAAVKTVNAKNPGKAAAPVKGKGKMAPPVLVTKPAPGARPNIRVVERTPSNVRPIGALPPEAVARATHKTPVVQATRASVPARPIRETKMDPGTQGVTDKDFQEFEQRLIAERQKIMKEMGYLESTVLKINQRDSSGDLSGYSFHMADVGTDSMEREKAFLFASSEGRLLMEIDEALRKVYAGEYGKCEMCEKPIARARLEAMPYARLCVSCKEQQERENRGGGGNAQNP